MVDLYWGLYFVDKDYISVSDVYCVSWEIEDVESSVLKSEVFICFVIDVNNCLVKNMDIGNCIYICIVDLEFYEGVKYVIMICFMNIVGRVSELLLDGFVVDLIFLIVGEIMYVENFLVGEFFEVFIDLEIFVKWSGFLDMESEIEKYFVCVGI